MTPSQTTGRKTCKLSMICINLFSNNKDGCGGKTKCAIVKEKLNLSLPDFCFQKKESNLI